MMPKRKIIRASVPMMLAALTAEKDAYKAQCLMLISVMQEVTTQVAAITAELRAQPDPVDSLKAIMKFNRLVGCSIRSLYDHLPQRVSAAQ